MTRDRKWAAVVFVIILVGLASWAGWQAVSALQRVGQISASLRSLEPELIDLQSGSFADIGLLQDRVAQVGAELDRAKSEIAPFVWFSFLLGWVPRIGPKLHSARDMLDLGGSLVSASLNLSAALNIIAPSNPKGNFQLLQGNRLSEEVLRSLAEGEPFYRSALTHLEQVKETLESLENQDLPQDLQAMLAVAQRLAPELEAFARGGLAASQSWQSFLGYKAPRTYLIVAQNSDELRASGGFIPGAWLLTLDRGEIRQLQFWDTVAVDNLSAGLPIPPEGLLLSLWGGVWVFRDAGWYPDFPLSASVIEQLFRLGQGVSVDGVIALDQWAVEEMIHAIGPVTLPTRGRVDGASYMQVLEEETDEQGREFIDTFLQVMLDRLRQKDSAQDLLALLAALNRSLDQKHFLMYFHNPTLQDMARNNGWDGALKEWPGDYIMVVDSNVGFSKVNRSITQRIYYQVDLSANGEAEARLDILYSNTSSGVTPDHCEIQALDRAGVTYQQLKNTCYWDYLRVYVPLDSALEISTPFPMPQGALYRRIGYNDIEDTLRSYSESGKKVFAGFFNVEVGESRRVTFVYKLPSHIVEGDGVYRTYNLFLQKQPGTQSMPYEVTIRLPTGYRFRRALPSPTSVEGQVVRFSINLDSDTTLKLILSK